MNAVLALIWPEMLLIITPPPAPGTGPPGLRSRGTGRSLRRPATAGLYHRTAHPQRLGARRRPVFHNFSRECEDLTAVRTAPPPRRWCTLKPHARSAAHIRRDCPSSPA